MSLIHSFIIPIKCNNNILNNKYYYTKKYSKIYINFLKKILNKIKLNYTKNKINYKIFNIIPNLCENILYNQNNFIKFLNKRYIFSFYYLNYNNSIKYLAYNNFFQNQIDKKIYKCHICYQKNNNYNLDFLILSCGHIFCYNCIINSFLFNDNCPLCRNKILPRQNLFLTHTPNKLKYIYGNKITYLLKLINIHYKKTILIITSSYSIITPLKLLINNLNKNIIFDINKEIIKKYDIYIFLEFSLLNLNNLIQLNSYKNIMIYFLIFQNTFEEYIINIF